MHIHETHGLLGVLIDAVMITGFVLVIMLVVEYFNVLSSGALQGKLIQHKWQQYALAALLGGMPGCLGSFAVVSMYTHGVLSFGAVVTAMIATTGDESFIMLATMPRQALTLILCLSALGFIIGPITDLVLRKLHPTLEISRCLELHDEAHFGYFNPKTILNQWKNCSPARGILTVALAVFTVMVISGQWETDEWDWQRVTLLVVSLVALFVVSTVPDHFLEDHLWGHVARKHAPRIFAWTLGILVILFFLTKPLEDPQLHAWMDSGKAKWLMLLFACAVGIIPQSGPHLLFVFAFTKGAVPLGVLVASCIVQDGHGMLPMLAHSRRTFVVIKALKIALALMIGGALIATGL